MTAKHCSVAAGQFVQFLFHLDVRHHFAADLAEAGQPVGDGEETILIERGDVAGDIPAVAKNLRRLLRFAEVTFHHVRPAHEQQARLANGQWLECVGIDDAHADAGQRMADLAALGADLAETRGAEVARVHRHGRRAFGQAIAFERADAELVLKRLRDAVGQFLRAGHDELQAAEIFRFAAADVHLQERRRRQQERHAVVAHQRADGFRVERADMIDHANAEHGGQR